MMVWTRILLVCLSLTSVIAVRHIVVILADDVGWNDVGFHNPDILTPKIDQLAAEGVVLNNAYVQPTCSPSRHAIMTGTHPYKHGMQRGVISPNIGKCSPLDLEFLPEKLKELGYATHMVGKWHLGYCNVNSTPTYRGFDTFLGFYNGIEDYYDKALGFGYDFTENNTPTMNSEYSTFVYSRRAEDIIYNHNESEPLFLYLPFQSAHNPLQVPHRFERLYSSIKSTNRTRYSAMISAMDEAVGNVTEALKESGLYNNTLIIFSSDNGGMPTASGNNYPLRGGKGTIFEGGTRAAAFVHGAGLKKTGYTYNGMMHAVDWFPTVIAAAGGQPVTGTDGLELWKSISEGLESPRTEFVYNLDDKEFRSNGHAAIRVGDYKLIVGYPGPFPDWYKPELVVHDSVYSDTINHIDSENVFYRRKAEQIMVPGVTQYEGEGLYNLKDDPNERIDISAKHPDIVTELKAKLDEYQKSMVSPPNMPNDPRSDPRLHGGFWRPGWC